MTESIRKIDLACIMANVIADELRALNIPDETQARSNNLAVLLQELSGLEKVADKYDICPACHGTGKSFDHIDQQVIPCPKCK